MMTPFGVRLDAVSPWFLVAIPLALGLLIYIFRTKGISQPKITSTLFLLRKLPSYLPQRRKFVPPLQFWLELLAFIILSLAVSGLFMSQTGERIAIIIDASLSMAAHQSNGETRLETAKRIASADISSSAPTTRFAVFAADSVLIPLSPNGTNGAARTHAVSARSARSLVEQVQQRYTTDRLQSVLTDITRTSDYDGVWVYTDKAGEDSSISSSAKVISIPSDTSSHSNAWIDSVVALESPSTPNAPAATYLQVTLSASGAGEFVLEVGATCVATEDREEFTLPAITARVQGGSTSTSRLGPLTRSWEYCHVKIRSSPTQTLDHIELDNEAWIARPSSAHTIVLHSSLTPRELGLQRLPYSIATPSTSPDATPELHSIYHRQLTGSLPPTGATLIVFPPAGSQLWGGGKVAARDGSTPTPTAVTRWVESHPLLQYVQPTLLSIPTAVILTCPDTATPILFASEGPLICAGEESGARYIIVGFELFPFDGIQSPTVSIVTLNALRWLFQPSGAASAGQDSSVVTLTSSAQIGTITLPHQIQRAERIAPTTQVLTQRPTRSLLSDLPGIISVTRATTSGEHQSLLAVNAHSDEESNLSHSHTLTLEQTNISRSSSGGAAATQSPEKHRLESLLTALFLIIVLIDLLRRIVTRSRWGGAV